MYNIIVPAWYSFGVRLFKFHIAHSDFFPFICQSAGVHSQLAKLPWFIWGCFWGHPFIAFQDTGRGVTGRGGWAFYEAGCWGTKQRGSEDETPRKENQQGGDRSERGGLWNLGGGVGVGGGLGWSLTLWFSLSLQKNTVLLWPEHSFLTVDLGSPPARVWVCSTLLFLSVGLWESFSLGIFLSECRSV